MNKQVLSTEQMKSLIKLGIDYRKASMCECISGEGKQVYIASDSLSFLPDGDDVTWTVFKVFTLQDLIELLPKTISNTLGKASLLIAPNCLNTEYQVMYVDGYGSYEVMHQGKCILDAAYRMLIWVIENGHLKTE